MMSRLFTASANTLTGTSKRLAGPSSLEPVFAADFTEPDCVVVWEVEAEAEDEKSSPLPLDDEPPELPVEAVRVSPSTGNITASALTSSSALPFRML